MTWAWAWHRRQSSRGGKGVTRMLAREKHAVVDMQTRRKQIMHIAFRWQQTQLPVYYYYSIYIVSHVIPAGLLLPGLSAGVPPGMDKSQPWKSPSTRPSSKRLVGMVL